MQASPTSSSKKYETRLMAHLALQGVENFFLLYKKLNHFVLSNIELAETSNREYIGPSDTKHNPYIYSVQQEALYAEFAQLQTEIQHHVAEPITG